MSTCSFLNFDCSLTSWIYSLLIVHWRHSWIQWIYSLFIVHGFMGLFIYAMPWFLHFYMSMKIYTVYRTSKRFIYIRYIHNHCVHFIKLLEYVRLLYQNAGVKMIAVHFVIKTASCNGNDNNTHHDVNDECAVYLRYCLAYTVNTDMPYT